MSETRKLTREESKRAHEVYRRMKIVPQAMEGQAEHEDHLNDHEMVFFLLLMATNMAGRVGRRLKAVEPSSDREARQKVIDALTRTLLEPSVFDAAGNIPSKETH